MNSVRNGQKGEKMDLKTLWENEKTWLIGLFTGLILGAAIGGVIFMPLCEKCDPNTYNPSEYFLAHKNATYTNLEICDAKISYGSNETAYRCSGYTVEGYYRILSENETSLSLFLQRTNETAV